MNHVLRAAPGPGALTAAVLLIVSLAAALTVDVVKTSFGIKGDEATYVAMALSLAYDHDLSYERRDLDRFFGLYRAGPDGIFLKRGAQWHVRLRSSPPYIHVSRGPDPRSDRLYFGKALIYPAVAAPFVRLFGLNGLLVFHVLLLFGVCVCGYLFLAAQSPPGPALVFTLAFVGATVVPVMAVFLTSDIFNFALVFFAYFLWLYKEVAPPGGSRFLRSAGSDICAAILLGLATYSKPHNALLASPLVVGVGETGLDYYRERAPADVQQRVFRNHIALARETDRGRTLCFVRPPGITDPRCADDLVSMLVDAGHGLPADRYPIDGIVFPKVRHIHEVRWLDELLTQIENEVGLPPNSIRVSPVRRK